MIVRDRLSGLFRKYFLILFVAVSAPVAISGLVEARFSYWDQRARLDQLLGVQAAVPHPRYTISSSVLQISSVG